MCLSANNCTIQTHCEFASRSDLITCKKAWNYITISLHTRFIRQTWPLNMHVLLWHLECNNHFLLANDVLSVSLKKGMPPWSPCQLCVRG